MKNEELPPAVYHELQQRLAQRDALLRTQVGNQLHALTQGPVVLAAQSYLVEWYSSLGFQVDGPEFLDDGIPHTPMRLTR